MQDATKLVSSLSHLNVLVIDDDDLMIDIVSAWLDKLGVLNTTCCNNGSVALETMKTKRLDIIIMDLKMPEMDGIELLRFIAEHNFLGGILLFSGQDIRLLKTAQRLAHAHGLNVLGTISKPVTYEELKSKLLEYQPKDSLGSAKAAAKVTADQVSPEELRKAILASEITPFFQPKVRITDKAIASVEALARWYHPVRGVLLPSEFISIAEEQNLIDPLTRLIIRKSLAALSRWHRQGYEISISINLSADNLQQIDLPEQIADLAKASDIPCTAITLEITETRLLSNYTASLDVLARLHLFGFGLSIDDFGTGYSSMEQLNNIPFSELKIDYAFVHGSAADSSAQAILESSTELANKLEMDIVAEGVEDQADWDMISAVKCDLVQGYFIAKPMAEKDLLDWMKNWPSGIA